VWALATSPKEYLFITSGADGTLRLWDLETRRQLAVSKKLDAEVRAIDWASNDQFIAVGDYKAYISVFMLRRGAAGGSGGQLTYEFVELDRKKSKFSDLKTTAKKAHWIEDLKISPDCTKLAFGAHGGASHVEIFPVLAEKGNQLGPSYNINASLTLDLTHLDWSSDSNFLVVNSLAYELKFISS
jgi:microtubule-associated protein-like 6